MRLKFEDCSSCRFRRKKHICADCDVGELYEDNDRPGVDVVFRDAPSRFGESVSADDDDDSGTVPTFNPDRFAEEFGGDEEDQNENDA